VIKVIDELRDVIWTELLVAQMKVGYSTDCHLCQVWYGTTVR